MKPDPSDEVTARVVAAIEKIILDEDTTAREIAVAIGTTSARLSDWKKGRGIPTVKNLALLRSEYFIDGNYLLAGEDEYGMRNISEILRELNKRIDKIEGAQKGVRK